MRKRSVNEINELIRSTAALNHQPQLSTHFRAHIHQYSTAASGEPEPVAPRLVVTEMNPHGQEIDFVGVGASETVCSHNPGANAPAKRWPIERLVEAARKSARTNCVWLILEEQATSNLRLASPPALPNMRHATRRH
jgi:hypothetical protein